MPGTRTLETMGRATRYNRWIFDRVRQHLGRRVLEVGCGTGAITDFLVDRDLVVAIDVVDAYVRAVRDRYRDRSNMVVLQHDLTRSFDALRHYRFDSGLGVNVFEHIEDDLAALRAVHALLEPGGTLALLVPCHRWLWGPFDRAIGHHRRYTKRDLKAKLEQAGFTDVRLRRSNPVGAIGWFVSITVLRQPELRAIAVYDRLVPVLAWLDRLVELPLGLSLVAVGHKPGDQAGALREAA